MTIKPVQGQGATDRAQFSTQQVEAYLDRVKLPEHTRKQLSQGPNGDHALEAVTLLQRHHLANIPFENLALHYTKHHSITQDLDLIFDRVVHKGLGGVCDQIHPLFAKLLQFFGFTVYCTGSRINAAAGILANPRLDKSVPSYGPWVHLNTIVTIGTRRYIVDTSHGPSGSPTPIPLVQGEEAIDVWPRRRRVVFDSIPGWTDQDQKWWRVQIRYNEADPWLDVWCFTETEWLPVDFQLIRLGYASLGTGWVAPSVCCFQTTYEDQEAVGYLLILESELRKHYKGETEVLQTFYSEDDRALALEKYFGIKLSEAEKRNIIGYPSEIKGDEFDFYG